MQTINELTQVELNRYMRQLSLNTIGIEGQEKLRNARILCIGAGGLGSPLLLYLAAAGVGTLGIIDNDCVETSNLPRQILFQDQHIGSQKAITIKHQLMTVNPHVQINSYAERFTTHHDELVNQYDMIADCSDNFTTRYLVNDLCFQLVKPYVFASVQQFQGQCSTFLGSQGPCYKCLFPSQPLSTAIPNCNVDGILGVLPGLFGIIQASEIIKWILQVGDLLVGRLLTFDMLKMQFREFKLTQNPNCDTCIPSCLINAKPKAHYSKPTSTMNDPIISPHELNNLLKNKHPVQLVDVRTSEMHSAFNIDGSNLIPLEELSNRLQELDPNHLVVTYCTLGRKSMIALQLLLRAGFKQVKSLDGGITAWQALILPSSDAKKIRGVDPTDNAVG